MHWLTDWIALTFEMNVVSLEIAKLSMLYSYSGIPIWDYNNTVEFISPILSYWCYVIVRIWKRWYESTSLNRIVADKPHRVIVA